jgi:hypothetical protein
LGSDCSSNDDRPRQARTKVQTTECIAAVAESFALSALSVHCQLPDSVFRFTIAFSVYR